MIGARISCAFCPSLFVPLFLVEQERADRQNKDRNEWLEVRGSEMSNCNLEMLNWVSREEGICKLLKYELWNVFWTLFFSKLGKLLETRKTAKYHDVTTSEKIPQANQKSINKEYLAYHRPKMTKK
jgi:hypothetical protein